MSLAAQIFRFVSNIHVLVHCTKNLSNHNIWFGKKLQKDWMSKVSVNQNYVDWAQVTIFCCVELSRSIYRRFTELSHSGRPLTAEGRQLLAEGSRNRTLTDSCQRRDGAWEGNRILNVECLANDLRTTLELDSCFFVAYALQWWNLTHAGLPSLILYTLTAWLYRHHKKRHQTIHPTD